MNISPISRSAVYGLWLFLSPSRTRSRWVNMWTSVWTVFSPPPPLGYCLIIRRTAQWWMGELYQIALWRSHEICTQSCGQIWKQCFTIFLLSHSWKCPIVLWHFLNLSKWDICPHRSSLSGSIVYSHILTSSNIVYMSGCCDAGAWSQKFYFSKPVQGPSGRWSPPGVGQVTTNNPCRLSSCRAH